MPGTLVEAGAAISRLISWTSSSSISRRIALEASCPIITMRIAALRTPETASGSALPTLAIQPRPDHACERGRICRGFVGDVFAEYFGFLTLDKRSLE